MKLEEFLRMSDVERHQYITEHGLTDAERQELLAVNKIIHSMLQQDSYRRGNLNKFKYILRFICSWLFD